MKTHKSSSIKPSHLSLLLGLALLGTSVHAHAELPSADTQGGMCPGMCAMDESLSHSVPVITGGVSEEGRAKLQTLQSDYSLKVVFTGTTGAYVNDVRVKIEDKNGHVYVNDTSADPVLLAALPAGKYAVTALYDGTVRTKTITVPASGLHTLQLRFPTQDEQTPV